MPGLACKRCATSATPHVTYLFTGYTVLTPSNTVLQRLTPSSTKWILDYAAGVFRLLEHVALLPSEDEMRQLDRLGMRDYYRELFADYIVPDAANFSWYSQPICIGDLHVSVLGHVLPLPLTGSRAREVRIIGYWKVPVPNAEPPVTQYLDSLGGLVPHTSTSELARQRVQALLASSSSNFLGSWRAQVLESVVADPVVTGHLDSLNVALSHSADSTFATSTGRDATTTPFKDEPSCGTCHRDALEIWRNTRHARALLTLDKVGKRADPRCTPCHTDPASVEGRSEATFEHGVGCLSCHNNGEPVQLNTCTNCHTKVTDPAEHYKLGFSNVCVPGDDAESAGRNSSRCMLTE